jgi:hypothetical protein
MQVENDNGCSWINDLDPKTNIKSPTNDIDCGWLIIGAGFTGLSAARKSGEIYQIII